MQPDHPGSSPRNSLTQNWFRTPVASSPFQPVSGLQSDAARAISSSTWQLQNLLGDSSRIQSQQSACAIPTSLPSNYVQSMENYYCFQSFQSQDIVASRRNPNRVVGHEACIVGPTEVDFMQHLLESSDRSAETLGKPSPTAYLTFTDGHFICEQCKIIAFLCEIQFIHLKFTSSIEIAFKN